MKKLKEYEYLVDALNSLPSIGIKNARKLAYFIIKQDMDYCRMFSSRIVNARTSICFCSKCHNITDKNICDFCLDFTRAKKLCIISDVEDLEKIEKTNFDGYYHVLHGELDIRKNINNKNIFIDDIKERIIQDNIKEVLIATSYSVHGENTANYIINLISSLKDVEIYRIGFGIPLNSSIDYIDQETLNQSVLNKKKIK